MLPNIKAVDKTQAALYVLEVEELDVCIYIRHLLANLVTYCSINNGRMV